MSYQKAYRQKTLDDAGNTVSIDVVEDMTEEEIAEFIASQDPDSSRMNLIVRDTYLKETDWTQGADVPSAIKTAYVTYRQALRDITEHADWPELTREDWPTPPTP